MAKARDMTQGSPARLLAGFALPLMLGHVFQQIYNVADSAIVGRLISIDAFAAVGAAGFLSWLVTSAILGLTQGFGTVFAQRFGAGDIAGLYFNPRSPCGERLQQLVFCRCSSTI